MKKRLVSGILAAALIMTMTTAGVNATGFIGSVFNKNNGVSVSQEEDKKPVVKTETGETKELTVVVTPTPSTETSQETPKANTQEERQEIVKKAETTIIVTQSTTMNELLNTYVEKETSKETSAKEALDQLVENGVSVLDAVKTVAMSTTVQQSSSVSEVLDNLSEEVKPMVQEAVKEEAQKLLAVQETKTAAMQTALEIAKEMMQTEEKVDVQVIKETIAAQDEEQAAHFEKVIQKLEQKNVEITPEVIEKVIKKQEEHKQVLKEIEAGNVDQMKVHSVVDVSVSDDVKEMIAGENDYVEISIEMPGVDEDTLVIALKPLQDGEFTVEDEEIFHDVHDHMNQADTKELFAKLGNRFIIINCTSYDGGVTLEMGNFSPVMFLTYADKTTEVDEVEVVEEPTEEAMSETEEAASDSNIGLIAAVIVVICGGAAVVMKKKKS